MKRTMGDISEAYKVKLAGLNASSQSIETLSHRCVFHRKKAKDLVKVWERELQGAAGKRKLVFSVPRQRRDPELPQEGPRMGRRAGPSWAGP